MKPTTFLARLLTLPVTINTKSDFLSIMKTCIPWTSFFLGAFIAGTAGGAFVPDFKIKTDDYTVLMAADGNNPEGLKPWISDHRKSQVKNWPLGGTTTWQVEVLEAGDYAVNALFNHSPSIPLKVTVLTKEASFQSVSQPVKGFEWRRFVLAGTLHLKAGKQEIALRIEPADGVATQKIEVLSIELVRPEVKERLHAAAMEMRAKADTQGFRNARYGLMFHWTSTSAPRTGDRKAYAEAVRDFDLKTFVEQVRRSGAGFVTLTTSHAEMYFPAPLKSLERILPGRTAQRDLVGELAKELGQHGIRLFLYYHLGASSDKTWQKACGFDKTDTTEFWTNWKAVISEVGERYGEQLAGWWFDDGTFNYYYRSAPWQQLASAAKAGNPKRMICFNPWTLPSATEFQDYFSGEGYNEPSLGGWLRRGDHGRISGGSQEGLQASSALVMEANWDHSNRDTEIGAPRYTPAGLAELLRTSAELGNVPMLNCEIYQEGTFSPKTVELIRTAAQQAGLLK